MLRLALLGPLVVERDGERVPVRSGRQRSLLALLVLARGEPLSRERLIDELWGERPPPSAVSALHVHLSKLRTLVGDALRREASGYVLDPQSYELDVHRFEELVERARTDPWRAGVLLREALALFRGEPLGDVAPEGAAAEWRRALEERRLVTLEDRIDADLAAGLAGELVPELEALVARHPFEERLAGQLLLALHRARRSAEALDAFQRVRRRFAEELGLEPGEPLQQLQRRILDRDPDLLVGPVERQTAPRGSRLPASPTRLVGREAELLRLASLLREPDGRLITLAGPGGVGKTRLALELARELEPAFSDGALFVPLEQLVDPELVRAEIATALSRHEGLPGIGVDSLGRHLRQRDLLLVLDNFEQVLAGAPAVGELLVEAPDLRIVVSSRAPLRLRAERVFAVEPLSLPAQDADPAQSPAVQLFVQRALAADPELRAGDELAAAALRICRALDGLPLPIELAGSRTRVLTAQQVAERVEESLAFAGEALRDLPDRQRTLEATIRWSYDLLEPGAQELLRAAGVFLGGFTLDALAAAAGRPPDVEPLVEGSLVRKDGTRFRLLDTIRRFARDRLAQDGELAGVRDRHCRYFAELVGPACEAFDEGVSPAQVAQPLAPDHANLRAAFEHALERGEGELATRLALGLRPLWLAGALREEAHDVVGRLLDGHSPPAADELRLLRAASFLVRPPSDAFTRRLLARAVEAGDADSQFVATFNLASYALNAQELDEARRLSAALVELVTPETSPVRRGLAEYQLALHDYVAGDATAASEHAARSVAAFEEAGHVVFLAGAVAVLLHAESARDGRLALPAVRREVELARQGGTPELAVVALWCAARYAAPLDADRARRWLALAAGIQEQADAVLWPENVLRDEALELLGDAAVVPAAADHLGALADAGSWLGERDPAEHVPRAAVSVA